jgi:hypothetical protein
MITSSDNRSNEYIEMLDVNDFIPYIRRSKNNFRDQCVKRSLPAAAVNSHRYASRALKVSDARGQIGHAARQFPDIPRLEARQRGIGEVGRQIARDARHVAKIRALAVTPG